MTKTVAAEMFAAIPASDHDQMIFQTFALQHADDDHPRTGFPIIAF